MLKGMVGNEVAVLVGDSKKKDFRKEKGIVTVEFIREIGEGSGLTASFVEVRLNQPELKLNEIPQPPQYVEVQVHRVSGAWRTGEWPDRVMLWKKHIVKTVPYRYLEGVKVRYEDDTYEATVRFHEGPERGGPLAVAELDVNGATLEVEKFHLLRGL